MPRKKFAIGHKNPDTDSIVSALAYAEPLRLQGEQYVKAARQGEVWCETRFVLEHFALPLPALVSDVKALRPRRDDYPAHSRSSR